MCWNVKEKSYLCTHEHITRLSNRSFIGSLPNGKFKKTSQSDGCLLTTPTTETWAFGSNSSLRRVFADLGVYCDTK